MVAHGGVLCSFPTPPPDLARPHPGHSSRDPAPGLLAFTAQRGCAEPASRPASSLRGWACALPGSPGANLAAAAKGCDDPTKRSSHDASGVVFGAERRPIGRRLPGKPRAVHRGRALGEGCLSPPCTARGRPRVGGSRTRPEVTGQPLLLLGSHPPPSHVPVCPSVCPTARVVPVAGSELAAAPHSRTARRTGGCTPLATGL